MRRWRSGNRRWWRACSQNNELQQSVTEMLGRGACDAIWAVTLLEFIYQSQSYLRHLQDINRRFGGNVLTRGS